MCLDKVIAHDVDKEIQGVVLVSKKRGGWYGSLCNFTNKGFRRGKKAQAITSRGKREFVIHTGTDSYPPGFHISETIEGLLDFARNHGHMRNLNSGGSVILRATGHCHTIGEQTGGTVYVCSDRELGEDIPFEEWLEVRRSMLGEG